MKKDHFLNMLAQVDENRSYAHVNDYGLCNWVWYSMDHLKQYPLGYMCLEEIEPDTITAYGILAHFYPTIEDENKLISEDKDISYWGSDSIDCKYGRLTELRETILLFCAAINGEL